MPIRKELDELRKKGNVTLQDLINFFGREDIQQLSPCLTGLRLRDTVEWAWLC